MQTTKGLRVTVHDMLLELQRRGYDVSKALTLEEFFDVPVLKSNRYKTRAGTASRKLKDGSNTITLSSLLWLAPGNAWDYIHETFLHELAHVMSSDNTAHGTEWMNNCRYLGIKPERYHDYQHMGRQPLKVVAACDNCKTEWQARKRLAKRKTYSCPYCKIPIRKF